MKNKEDDRKIEVETLLKDSDVSPEAVDKITSMIEQNQYTPVEQTEEISTLKIKLMEEKDWRKKAAIAAMIISNSIE